MNTVKLEDRKYLKTLCEALNVSEGRLKTDEYGDWNIVGIRGHIFTEGDLWYVFVEKTSKRKWSSIKHKLSFMEVSQDGDDEGIFKLLRMPSQEEAEVVRDVIGLRSRPALTEEYRQTLITRGLSLNK